MAASNDLLISDYSQKFRQLEYNQEAQIRDLNETHRKEC